MADLATINERKAKTKQKSYYDKKSRSRKLEVGQKVLVLLPTHTSKLLASWKGPYTIIDKVSPVDYKIKINGKTEKIFHVNMLKLWYERTDDIENSRNEVFACLDVISGLSTPDEDCDSDLNVSLTPNIESKESINDVTICDELTVEQKQQLHDLLSDYSDIFSDVPQVTNVIKHVVNTRTNDPIYKRSYPLPYAMRNQVKEEVDKMLKAGIVESSDSPYAAPVVCPEERQHDPFLRRFQSTKQRDNI